MTQQNYFFLKTKPLLEFSNLLHVFKRKRESELQIQFCSITMLFWFLDENTSTKSCFAFF